MGEMGGMTEGMMLRDLLALLPEASLAAVAVLGLLLGSFLPPAPQWPEPQQAAPGPPTQKATPRPVWNNQRKTPLQP
ncbi:hypothetical protein, partial [Nocardia abscessus]|uniref:hypothetical protein n=1 Tax=Nocardia abscessus TaxID=120957 RepID=UPI002456B06E